MKQLRPLEQTFDEEEITTMNHPARAWESQNPACDPAWVWHPWYITIFCANQEGDKQ